MRLPWRSRPEKDPLLLFLTREPPPAPLALAHATAADGTPFWPAFTSRSEVLRWVPEGGPLVEGRLSSMRDVMRESGITLLIIDPGSPDAWLVRLEDLA